MSKIYVSPSLQDANIGYGSYGSEESRMTLIGDSLVAKLKNNGFEVYRNSRDMTLAQAVADSNSKNVDLHIAVHSDAGGGRGCTAFYKSANGQRIANAIYENLSPITPDTSDNGVRYRDNLYELNNTKAVATLVEVSFHDNPDDAAWIMSHIDDIATAFAKGACKYFGVAYNEAQIATAPTVSADKIKAIQELCNILRVRDENGNALVVDGIVGAHTRYAVANLPVIKEYSNNDNAVRVIQMFVGTKVDGSFGPMTLTAVKNYQSGHGLVVDGIVGSKTWTSFLG